MFQRIKHAHTYDEHAHVRAYLRERTEVIASRLSSESVNQKHEQCLTCSMTCFGVQVRCHQGQRITATVHFLS